MKRLFLLFFILLLSNCLSKSFAQCGNMGRDNYPAISNWTADCMTVDEAYENGGHNYGDENEKANSSRLIKIRREGGKYPGYGTADALNNLYYCVHISQLVGKGLGAKRKYTLTTTSIGNMFCNNNLDFVEETPLPGTQKSAFTWGDLGANPDYELYFTIDFNDFYLGDNINDDSYIVIIIGELNEDKTGFKEGYCDIQCFEPNTWFNDDMWEPEFNLGPTPSNAPTITVNPLEFCWTEKGTFDITKTIISTSPADATIKYYLDSEGNNEVTSDDLTNFVMPLTNPKPFTKYYAQVVSADGSGKSDIKEIVTFYQKPEVSLSLADNMTSPICSGSKVTLVANNDNTFVENLFRFYCAEQTLEQKVTTPANSYTISSFQTAGTYKVYATSAENMGKCVDSAEIILEVKPSISSGDIIIEVTAGKNPSCEGESVTLTASSAKPGATFIWQNPKGDGNINAASITVAPTADKEYTVKADLNNCPSTNAKSQLIKVNPKPDINLTPLEPTCGVMVDLTQAVNSSNGVSYSYFADAGLTNEVPDPSQVETGTYYIKGTDPATTCYNSGAVTATVNPKPVPTITVTDGVTAACSGSTVTLTAGPDDNIKTYDWGNGVTGKEITPTLVDGDNSFLLKVIDNNDCDATVTTPTIIKGRKVPTVNITLVSDACAGTEIALEADVTFHDGATEQSVAWTKGAETIANALATTTTLGELANTYKVTVTDNNNCSGHDEITVNGNVLKVSLNASPSGQVATGTSVNLTATASWNNTSTNDVVYSWKKILPVPEEKLTESSKVLTVTPESNSTYQVQVSKEGCTATVNQEIEVLADPFQVGEISGGRALCAGDAFADAPMTLGLTVSGGQKNYTYVWTVPEGVTVSAKNAETLEITGIDYGQVSTGAEISVVVSDNTTPTPKSETRKYRLDITPIPEILINDKADGETLQACLGNELVLTARIAGVNGGSFVWTGGPSTSTLNADVTSIGEKTYEVTGTYNNCPATAFVKVNVNALPELALSMQVDNTEVTEVCPGTVVTLTASSTGITDASKYTWSGAASAITGLTGTVTPTVAGSEPKYIVEVNNGTCKNKLEKPLTVHTPGTLTITPSETEVCGGSLVTLTPGGGQDYVWSGDDVSEGTTDNPLEVTPDGSKTNYVYKLDGKDNNGCTAKQASQTIKVILSPVLVLAETELSECVGTTIDLRNAVNSGASTSGATLWVSKGTDAPTTTTTVSEAGEYNIFLKSGTCQTAPQQVTVTFNALPDISVSIADNKTNPCSGEKITLQASSKDENITFIYNGNRGGTSWEVTPTDLTGTKPVVTYEVTAENEAKCTKVGTVSVTVKPLPDVDIVVPGVVCENSLVKLEATGATTYVWNDKALTTGKELQVTATESNKVFTVIGTTDNCSKSKEVTLDLTPAPVLTLGTLADGCESTEMDLKDAVLSDGLTLTFYDQEEKSIADSKVTIDTKGDYTYYVQGTDGKCSSKKEPISFTVNPKPVLTFSGISTICEGETTEITVGGANTYTWQDGQKDNTNNPRKFTLTETGTFKVEGVGSNGCKADKEITINVNKKPVLVWDATTAGITSVVEGTSLTVQTKLKLATAPEYHYSWTHNGVADVATTDFFRTIAQLTSEEFTVTVTDDNNCVSEPLTKTVEVTPAGGVLSVTLASSSTTICQGGMQILTANPKQGHPDYTYKWFKDGNLIAGEEGSELIVTEAAKYKVEVSDESSIPQTAFAEKEMTIDATRPAPIVSVQNMTILSGTAVNLFAEVNPAGGKYTYNWSPKEQLADGQENAVYPKTKSLSVDQDYELYVTDDNGCFSKTATGKVKIDAAAFKVIAEVNKNEICIGGKALLNANVQGTTTPAENDLTYSWTPADNLTGADQKNPVFTSQQAGEQEFFVMVSDKNGHVAGATVKVNVNTNETPVLALTAKDAVSCVGQGIEVTTTETVLSYYWIIDGGEPIEAPSVYNSLGAGAHTVKVYGTDINGCPADTVEMDYFMNELPAIAWDDANEWSVDKGTDVTIKAVADNGAVGDYTYNWSVSASGAPNSDLYTVTDIQTDANFKVSVKNNTTGCSSEEIEKSVVVRAAKPKIEFETNVTNGLLCNGGVAILDVVSVKGGAGTTNVFTDYTYEWYKGTDLVASTKDFVVNAVGVYTVKVKDVDGRVSEPKTITVALSDNSAPVAGNGALTIAKGAQTYLYPNVTNGTPAYNYKWSPIDQLAGVDDIENPQTTPLNGDVEYKYYVIDANGCSSNYGTVAVTVVDPSAPEFFAVTASADRKQICNGNTTTLRVATSRALTNPVYEWSPASELDDPSSATPIFKPSVAADKMYTFTVKVTENGATSATAQVNVIVKRNPAPVLSLQSEGDCDGAKVIVNNSGEAVPANGYTWIIDGVRDTKVKSNEYALSAGDARKVEVYATSTNGCASDTAADVFNRKALPVLTWSTDNGYNPVNEKVGETFTMKVVSVPADVTYAWSYTFTPKGGNVRTPVTGTGMAMKVIDAEEGVYDFEVYAEKDGCRSEVKTKTVTVIPAGAVLDIEVSRNAATVCMNGTVKVFATGRNGDGKYSFKWYKGTTTSGTPVAEGDTAYLSLTGTTERYVVEVTDGLGATKLSEVITLTMGTDLAPSVSDYIQCVASGNSTVLLSAVNDGTAPYQYQWSPEDKLATDEQGKAHPETQSLTQQQKYTYYVTDANGCVSAPGTVTVNVETASDALAIGASTNKNELCIGNTAQFNVVATQGRLSDAATYEWIPVDGLSEANIVNPLFSATLAGVYEYVVKVTDGGKTLTSKVKVEVKNANAPTLAWDNTNPTSYEVGDPLAMRVTASGGAGSYTFHWLQPVKDDTERAGVCSLSSTTESKYTFEVYVTDANQCASSDTLLKDISAGSGVVPIEVEVNNKSCCAVAASGSEQVQLSADVTSGHSKVDYLWKGINNTIPLTNATTATVGMNVAGVAPGNYTFELKVTDQEHTDNTKTVVATLTIQALPAASINIDTVVCYKKDPFVLNVVNPSNNTYLWGESVYDMSISNWGDSKTKGQSSNLSGTMSDNDLRYVLTVIDKNTMCQAKDTAYVLRIPDAPVLAIDTNTNHLNIKLQWGKVNGADEYTVWSRKWDPYCMTAKDGGKYVKEASTTSLVWAEPSMDTLEFYYVTATRKIGKTKYHSVAGDTVGYYLYKVNKNSTGNSSFNMLAVMFDMSKHGKSGTKYETADMFKMYPDLKFIKYWKYNTQMWIGARKLTNGSVMNPFDITPGMLLQLDPNKEMKILQYGKLDEKLHASLMNTNTTTSNYSVHFTWIHRLDLKDADALLTEYQADLSFLKWWNFKTQMWIGARKLGNGKVTNNFTLKSLLPLLFDVKQSEDAHNVIWK